MAQRRPAPLDESVEPGRVSTPALADAKLLVRFQSAERTPARIQPVIEAALGQGAGQRVQWELLDQGELHWVRLASPPCPCRERASHADARAATGSVILRQQHRGEVMLSLQKC
jgi:hypothetical protein